MDKCSTYIKRIRGEVENVLVFDTGDFLPAIPDSERSEYIIQAMKSVEYDAITIGDQEFLEGELFIRNRFPLAGTETEKSGILINSLDWLKGRMDEKLNYPAKVVLSGNIFSRPAFNVGEKSPLFFSSAYEDFQDFRVQIYGLTDASAFLFFPVEKKGWFEVADWGEFLSQGMQAGASGDVNIVLSHSGVVIDEEMARNYPQIDIIISGHSQTLLASPLKVGATLILQAGGSVERLGRLDLAVDDRGEIADFRYQLISLTPEIPSDTVILQIIENYERAFFADKKPRPHIPVYPDTLMVVSAEKCKECHLEQYEQWKGTDHARAFETIQRRLKIYNPGCLSCHTTGFGHREGFVSLASTPEMKKVSCTECHYLPPEHITTPFHQKPLKISEQTCVRCHNKKNSPEFDYKKYRKIIVH